MPFQESSIWLPPEAFRSNYSRVVSVIYLTLNDIISLARGKSENSTILPNTTVVSSTVFPPPRKNFTEPVKIVLENKRVCWTLISKTATTEPSSQSLFITMFGYLLTAIYLTIRPVIRKGEAEWAIDPSPLRAKGLIVLERFIW